MIEVLVKRLGRQVVSEVTGGFPCLLTGGHGTRYLYKASVPLLSNEVCSYLMDRTISPGEICAGQKMGGVDACQVSACVLKCYV